MPPRLQVLDHVPDGLAELEASRLHEALAGPTLMHLRGRRPPTLFVSVLLHGNETSGWEAMRSLLHRYREHPPPRSLSLLVGNVQAARHGLRRLEGQPDYNRVWRGRGTPEHAVAREIVEAMRTRPLFASVDIHNTSGPNPHYAALSRLDPPFLRLATLFSRTVVYFTTPETVLCNAFAQLCPAVTVECGQPGHPRGAEHAAEYIDACLHLSELPDTPVSPHDVDLFHTVAVVRVPAHARLAEGDEPGDIRLADDVDRLNFRELPPGTALAWTSRERPVRLEAWDESGAEVGDRYFRLEAGAITTAVPVVPAMMTLDARIIRQDCLCYLMERYRL